MVAARSFFRGIAFALTAPLCLAALVALPLRDAGVALRALHRIDTHDPPIARALPMLDQRRRAAAEARRRAEEARLGAELARLQAELDRASSRPAPNPAGDFVPPSPHVRLD